MQWMSFKFTMEIEKGHTGLIDIVHLGNIFHQTFDPCSRETGYSKIVRPVSQVFIKAG